MNIFTIAGIVLKYLHWALYFCLFVASCWFVSGDLEHFLSEKTSFAQSEGISEERPVIAIRLSNNDSNNTAKLKYWTDIHINYCSGYKSTVKQDCKLLNPQTNSSFSLINNDTGENHTEIVYLEQDKYLTPTMFRIIPQTVLLDELGTAHVKVLLKEELNFDITFFLTSLNNSLGHMTYRWRDGLPLRYTVEKNHRIIIQIQPEKYKYLTQTSKCHEESYYDCIASELDKFDYHGICDKKCIPNFFAFGKNYTTPFCSKKMEDQCAFYDISWKIVRGTMQNFSSKCKKACATLQYSGNLMANKPTSIHVNNLSRYEFKYEFGNSENKCIIFEEYLIYDVMGMIGSVGGTLGMFIGFSMTGIMSSALAYFNKCKSLIDSSNKN